MQRGQIERGRIRGRHTRLGAAVVVTTLIASLAVLTSAAAPSQANPAPEVTAKAKGKLRVTTSPPVASVISVDGEERDTWGLAWLDLDSGTHEVCFSDVSGFATPGCQSVTVPAGGVGTATGSFTRLASLRVTTSPALPATITTRDITAGTPAVPRNDWGVYSWAVPGHALEVCFGAVADHVAPPCQTVSAGSVVAGETVSVTGTYTPGTGPAAGPAGYLRVTTQPAVASTISVDGIDRDDWALTWMKIEPGAHEVCFAAVLGYRTPDCATVTVTAGTTTTVAGAFPQQAWARVVTNPPVDAAISIDGIPRNNWGMWSPVEPGSRPVCVTVGAGSPSCTTAVFSSGSTTELSYPFPTAAPTSTIATGNAFSCGIRANGQVRCWGGQLTPGTTTVAYPVSGLDDAIEITAGEAHACARRASGTVVCWGSGGHGQLGNGSSVNQPTPVTVAGAAGATSVSAGQYHTCAVIAGVVKCWGANAFGQLGTGNTTSSNVPVAVSGITTATSVSAGYGHTCALLADGTARCWGVNLQGGLGTGTNAPSTSPVAVSGLTNAVAISAGAVHSCAILADRTARCWGGGLAVGEGTGVDRYTPVAVSGLTDVATIDAGSTATCASKADGTVWCWGQNPQGQLGDGTTTDRLTPVVATGVAGATGVSMNTTRTCASIAGGGARCWGDGNIGDGTLNPSLTAKTVLRFASTTVPSSVLGAGGPNTCAVVEGEARCWGGNMPDAPTDTLPVTMTTNATAVDVGGGFTCVLKIGGTVECWGRNYDGQLGRGTTGGDPLPPGPVSGLSGATAVDLGVDHSCALASGSVRCWGVGSSGQLGQGTMDSHATPVTVPGLGAVSAISAGFNRTCAVTSSGTAWCWGDGELSPVQVMTGQVDGNGVPIPLTGIAGIAVGNGHTCARTTGGAVWCWGQGSQGELGDGAFTFSFDPVPVGGLSGVTHLAAGRQHTCARRSNGAVLCWGDNSVGQLGDGSTTDRGAPTAASGVGDATSVVTGPNHTCTTRPAGRVSCWGDAPSLGTIGTGGSQSSPTPVDVLAL